MTKYRRYTIVDGKPRCIIVNDNGHVTNKYPNKDELKGLNTEKYKIKNAQYTDKELLNFLKLFYEENGRIPLQTDFVSNPGYPGYSAYQKRFGSWNNALILAELGTRQKDKQYTGEELLNFLRFFYEKNEIVPTYRYFRHGPNCPSTETYRKRFGSWNNALKLAGMDVDTVVEQGILQNEYHKGRLWEILITNMFGNRSIDLSGNNCCNTLDGICPNGQTYEAKSAGLSEKNYWGFGIGNRDKEDDKEAIE